MLAGCEPEKRCEEPGCEQIQQESHSNTGELLKGNHEVMWINDELGYFSRQGAYLHFYWRQNTGEFASSSVHQNKIRVDINPVYEKPFVKFRWRQDPSTDLSYIFDRMLVYMVICCKEEDNPVRLFN